MMKGIMKRQFALALVAVITFMLTSKIATAVEMRAGTPSISWSGPVASTTVVGFAGYEWLAISRNGNLLTLLAKNNDFGSNIPFNNNPPLAYVGGGLHTAMWTAYNGIANPKEKTLVQATSIDDAKGEPPPSDSSVTVPGQYFWPLSYSEAQPIHMSVLSFPITWWLRSPNHIATGGVSHTEAFLIDNNGNWNTIQVDISLGVRPAFNLDLSSIVFTSAASGAGVKPMAVGATLSAATGPTGAVKFTVESIYNATTNPTGLSLTTTDTATRTVQAGDTVNIIYTGAQTGTNKYVSCVIEAAGTVMYYGKLVDCTGGNASSTASFTVPALSVGTYTIKLFNEESNGDNYTDFCSNPITIPLTIVTAPAITSANNTSVASGTGGTFQVTASGTTPITYALTGAPADVNINTTSGLITVAPTTPVGNHTFTITASNGISPNATQNFTLTVTAAPASATVGNITISGTVGVALGGGQTATIALSNVSTARALTNEDVSAWFTGLPPGITVRATATAGTGTITLTFSGTPTAASLQQFQIRIPANVLTSNADLVVTANSNARFNIKGTPQPPSTLPKTGDSFPLWQLLALMVVSLAGLGWLGFRMRTGKTKA